MSDQPATHTARRAAIAAAAAAGALILGGIAVASAQPNDPAVTDTTIESTTTTAASSDTTDTTVDETTETTVDETTETTLDDTTTTEVEGDEAEGDDDATHPENHGKDVSEAAHDHSHDEEAGNHGKYVRGVARGDSTTSTTAPAGAETSTSGHGRRGR